MKRKIISAVVGVAGLVIAYFAVSGISNIIYHHPTESTAAQVETESNGQGTEEAKAALTEDEINEMLAGMKSTETAENETVSEETAVIPVKFDELQSVNAPYTWEVVGSGVLGDDLTVTGTFTSFSPVAFMVVDAADVAATGVKAPKTGEF